MRGFDPEFADIVDYILRITRRIWEGKQVGLCLDYYSDDCPVYTLAGYTEGAEAVTQNTLKTLAAFPDRTLHADNIIWSGDDAAGFHTSHLICSNMTNRGPSEFGPASLRQAQIQVIAHCVVRKNKIVEEWLVRDNYALCEQLGFNPLDYARVQAQQPLDPQSSYAQWLDSEIVRVVAVSRERQSPAADHDNGKRLACLLSNIWNARLLGDCHLMYADHARLHASARADYDGIDALQRFYIEVLGALPDARISIDHICENSMQSGDYVALRWTLAGHHSGASLWGAATGAPVLILGESHYRLEHGKVVEEWLVFDELAVLTQIERARLRMSANSG
jgi:predicted ester cyclase